MISLSTALTIIGSFGAASSAQIVSHILTQKREDKKFMKECLQNLYSPAIFDVIDYIKFEAQNYSPLPFPFNTKNETNVLFNKVMKNLGDNLKFADADLINIYQEVRNNDSYLDQILEDDDEIDNEIDDDTFANRMTLLNLFLTQYININKVLKSHANSITEKLIAPYFFTHFYLLVRDCYYLEFSSIEVLQLYDLVEAILLPENNLTEQIISIRKELYNVMYTKASWDKHRSMDAYASAYQFLYELIDEFSALSPDRADSWKEFLDENLPSNRILLES